MNPAIIIPARIGSKRIESKPLVNVLGQTALKWVVQTALKTEIKSEVIVCSDSQKVLDSVKDINITCNLSSKDYKSGTERAFSYVMGLKTKPSLIVVVDCGETMIRSKTIDELMNLVISGSCEISTCIQEVSGIDMADVNTIKASVSSNKEILYLSRSPIPFPLNKEDKKIKFWKQIGVTCYSLKAVKELVSLKRCDIEDFEDIDLLRALNYRMKIGTVGIDYPRTSLSSPLSLSQIEESISSERLKLGQPPKVINFGKNIFY